MSGAMSLSYGALTIQYRPSMRRRIVQTGVASNNEREVNVDGGEFQRGETAGRPAGER